MKNIAILAALAAIFVVGCGPKEDSTAVSSQSASSANGASSGTAQAAVYTYDLGSKKVGDKGICVVCSVRDGKPAAEEEVKETLDYKGKTYVFCNESEKAEFISDPKKFTSGK